MSDSIYDTACIVQCGNHYGIVLLDTSNNPKTILDSFKVVYSTGEITEQYKKIGSYRLKSTNYLYQLARLLSRFQKYSKYDLNTLFNLLVSTYLNKTVELDYFSFAPK